MTARKCMFPIAGQDPGSTATSRCSQSQAQDGHNGIGSVTSHLPSATSKSTDLTDQASFPSTDTVITTNKKTCPYAERNRQRVPVDILHDEGRSRASCSCAIFLLAPQLDRARVTMMYAHPGKLTETPFCLFLRSLRHPLSLHIHLKRTSMCGFSLNPPHGQPLLSLSPCLSFLLLFYDMYFFGTKGILHTTCARITFCAPFK